MYKFLSLILVAFLINTAKAQDTLPNFSLNIFSASKAQISWANPFSNCIQLSVQKSYDSLNFFKTIFSAQSPELPVNGYVDENYLSQVKVYYRIFYVLEDGKFFFTKSKSQLNFSKKIVATNLPNKDKIVITKDTITQTTLPNFPINPIKLIDTPKPDLLPAKRFFTIYKKSTDSLFHVLDELSYLKFKDSIAYKTKDTLIIKDNDIVIFKPFIPKPLWKPSVNVFTADKGYVKIQLPKGSKTHHYKLIFYNESKEEIFRIKQLKQDKLTLEKANFLQSGWFYFDLYEDEKLLEKNKFFIEKDF
jgi:hypothetical protein